VSSGSAPARVRQLLAAADNVILESNSVLRFLQPDLSLSVLDPSVADFKPSALRYLDRADALIVPADSATSHAWPGVSAQLLTRQRRFPFDPPTYCTPELIDFVAARVTAAQLTVEPAHSSQLDETALAVARSYSKLPSRNSKLNRTSSCSGPT
jgi:hypothetical protein